MIKVKKAMALFLALAMGASLAACGGSNKPAEDTTEEADKAVATDTTEAADEAKTEDKETEKEADEETAKAEADLSSDGKVLNIQCWDDEFARRLATHYPGYQANNPNDATEGGKIGDIEVKFIVNPKDDYQKILDETLPGNNDIAKDERVDIFLVEDDYALKYVNTDLCIPLLDLGIAESELLTQYKYTKDIATDSNGNLKGVSWKACPGVLIYNREAAKEILGSDDPEIVQAAVSDWDTYNETAKKALEAGYKMTATANDTFRVFAANVSSPWVVDGQIIVDDNLKKWVDISKEEVDAEICGTGEIWSDEWSAGLFPDGRVFCYFGPAWLIDFYMASDDPASIASKGGWAATTGPQSFSWYGAWLCPAEGTDNPALIADIIRKLTIDEDVMKDIFVKDNEFVNNKNVMEVVAQDDSYGDDVLGGQNAIDIFCESAENIDRSNISEYDQGCIDYFRDAMKDYFEGTTATYEEALDIFYKRVSEKYPELTY